MNSRTASGFYLLFVVAGILAGAIAGGEIVRFYYRRNFVKPIEMQEQYPGRRVYDKKTGVMEGTQAGIEHTRNSAIVEATRRVAPCVVGIVVTQLQVVGSSFYYGDFFDQFLTPRLIPRYREVENMGSGVVIDSKGIILTNNHVVEGAKKLYVNFPDGSRHEASVVGRDLYSDLAVVSVKREGLNCVRFGNSDELMIGEWVVAIGNPFLNFFNDPSPTVTVGVVSALNRNFSPGNDVYYQGMIQTDAAINPGNSGGALINAHGELVGINTFIYTGSGRNRGSIGIGFAIPSNRAKRVVDELLKYRRRRQVWTGITVQDMDRSIAHALGAEASEGVVVTDILRGSPGDIAGLRSGDVIVALGERRIRSHTDLEGFFLDYFVGDSVRMSFVRSGRKMESDLLLAEHLGKRG